MIGYYETLLQYYLPGVDVRSMTDAEFAMKLHHVLNIRQQEAASSVTDQLQKLLHG